MARADRGSRPGPAHRGRAVRRRGPSRGLSRVPRRGRGPRPGGPHAEARRPGPPGACARASSASSAIESPAGLRRNAAPNAADGGGHASAWLRRAPLPPRPPPRCSSWSSGVRLRAARRRPWPSARSRTDAWAEASLMPHPWGSEISVQVGGFHRGTMCQVWLRRNDGRRVSAGSFRYVYDGESERRRPELRRDPRPRHRDRLAGRLQDLRGAAAVPLGGHGRLVVPDNLAAGGHLMRPRLSRTAIALGGGHWRRPWPSAWRRGSSSTTNASGGSSEQGATASTALPPAARRHGGRRRQLEAGQILVDAQGRTLYSSRRTKAMSPTAAASAPRSGRHTPPRAARRPARAPTASKLGT